MDNHSKNDSTNATKPLLIPNISSSYNNGELQITNSNKSCIKRDTQRVLKRGVSIKEENEKDEKDWELVPPDGGWGWLVLLGSTLVNIIVPGTVKSFGVLFVEFLEAFNTSQVAASWIPALCYFLYSSLGPLSGILSLKYSYRTVTLIGGTCAALGMILSSWAQSIPYLYVSYGILVGTGAGLAFPPTVYIVTNYFVKKRGLANGICISGSAFGSIILPPLLRFLLEVYDYRDTVLIMGAITLNTWVAALFFDPVEKHMKKVKKGAEEDEEDCEIEDSNVASDKYIGTIDNSASLQLLQTGHSFLENQDDFNNSFVRSVSSAAVPSYKEQIDSRERKISVPNSKDIVRARIGHNDSKNQLHMSGTLQSVPEKANTPVFQSQSRITPIRRSRSGAPRRNASTSSFQYISTPYHGSTLTLQPEQFASSFSLRSSSVKGKGDALEEKKSLFDLSLLKDPLYLIILISNATNAISYTNFFILLPSYALDVGYDKTKGTMLIPIVSAFDLIGRIGGSALSDISSFPKEWYFIGGLLISGVSLAALPFSANYIILSTFCAVFGLASGVYVGITTVIMADLLGTEKIQSSYGISLFVNGVLQLIGPPICGLWFEIDRSYTSMFFWLGLILIAGASLWIFYPFIKKKDKSKELDTMVKKSTLKSDLENC
ncbi:monocarboxylate transporter 13 [Agrilus planipennis]|uniref:Monocarboxylate transporter 13 n=1 Tax=Agrilus planipennis TaxID=224129 RepID=A0A1W4XDG7_AGRPL|nr:monocarboxylate transporter 13 [Agrilus planipennis]